MSFTFPDTSISGGRVARELTAIIERRGQPAMIDFGYGNGADTRAEVAGCVEDYNTERPHTALGYETPAAGTGNLATAADRYVAPRSASAQRTLVQAG